MEEVRCALNRIQSLCGFEMQALCVHARHGAVMVIIFQFQGLFVIFVLALILLNPSTGQKVGRKSLEVYFF